MALTRAAGLNEVKLGMSKAVTVNGRRIALFNVDGKIFATDNACLHQGGPLGDGELMDNVITCPLHGWQYDVCSGTCFNMPSKKLETFKVEVRDGDIFVDI
ncbi:MAG TPA: non-heme iron oxygenase ferredoxin subunit [Candidatus Bilamarchaeum sp.]|nr:non-heme iron oxygenase ferredoxin subunit [Candidatus Bilamarchaeum sp.]